MKKVSNLVSTILSSLVFALMPVVSQAIGLGNIMLHSHLNEPLEADIALTDLKGFDPSDVIVTVADQQAYEEAGLQPIGWLTSIRFQVLKGEVGGRPVLKLKTKEVVKDPFVDLLIEVKWPGGRLLREYTLLLDPPKSVIPTTRSIQKKQKISTVIGAQAEPIPVKEPVREAAPQVGASRHVKTVPGGTYGPIGDESLWSIAKSLSQNTHSNVHQAVMAIAEKNPHAFRDGNINYMLSGAVLKLPDKAELEHYSLEQSQYYIAMQGQTPYHEPHLAQAEHIFAAKPVVHKAHKPLKLVAPVQSLETAVKATTGTQAKPENQVVMAERLTLIEEAIDTLKRNNEDMTRKNQSLQNQNQSLEKLLSMKEDEIKKLVDMVKQPSTTPNTALTEPALAAPVTPASTSAPTNEVGQEPFAVAVSDVPFKADLGSTSQNLTAPNLADVTQASLPQVKAEPKPESLAQIEPNLAEHAVKPNAIKVDNIAPHNQAQTKAISADDDSLHLSPAKPLTNEEPAKSGSSALLWFLMLGLSAMAVVFAWLKRHFLQDVLTEKLHAFFAPREKDVLATVAVGAGEEVANYGLQFDLDRALDAIAAQEKKFKKATPLNLKQSKDNVENENRFDLKFADAEECISYERYGQAEKILKEVLQQKPDEWVAIFKLLELYVLTEKYAEFERLYEGLPKDLNDIAPRIWSKIETLSQKVVSEKAIRFQSSVKAEPVAKAPLELSKEIKSQVKDDANEFLDLSKDYPLALENDADTINIESLPSATVEEIEEVPTNNTPDIQKAQIALAKAYIDMGEFEDAKGILHELKKEATGNNLKQIDLLLESITHD